MRLTISFLRAAVCSASGSMKANWRKVRAFSLVIVWPVRYSPANSVPSSRWPRMVYLERGQVTARQMPCCS